MEEERMEESMIDNKGRLVGAVRVLRVCECRCEGDMVSNFFLFLAMGIRGAMLMRCCANCEGFDSSLGGCEFCRDLWGGGGGIRIFVSFHGTSAELLSVRHRNENRMVKMFFI